MTCKRGHTEIVKLLLARDDVDVNAKDGVSKQHSETLFCLTVNIGGENRTNQVQ